MVSMIDLTNNYSEALSKGTAVLRHGGLAAVPTETVYGLAADACTPKAVERIYAAKGRPYFNPLIAHVSGMGMAKRYGMFDDNAEALARAFWPGPLTLVVPLEPDTKLAEAVTAGLDTVALRHPIGTMATLAERLDKPLAAPSANSSGRISPTRAQHVSADLGDKIDLILDGGPCAVGLESTIVKCADGTVTLLREGGLSVEQIEAIVGPLLRPETSDIEAPGMMLKHYAPRKPLRLNADRPKSGEALLAFGANTNDAKLNLSSTADLEEAARNLFAMLHELDSGNATGIAVQTVPDEGIGVAINDRLRRAAMGANNT